MPSGLPTGIREDRRSLSEIFDQARGALSQGGCPMERQAVRLTRQELYEKMWSRPAIALAEEFGISGRGLGKMWSRFKIPVPPRGYWAKLAAGKHVTRIPLPTAKSDVGSEILIQPSPEGPGAALPEQIQAEVTAVLENRDQIEVPETLRSPHPIVKHWLDQTRERRKVDQLSDRRSEPPVLTEN